MLRGCAKGGPFGDPLRPEKMGSCSLINHVVVSSFIAVSAQESSAFTDKVFLLGYSSKNKFCEYVLV